MMGWEKVPCELKDHIQHGLIKQTCFDKRFREINYVIRAVVR